MKAKLIIEMKTEEGLKYVKEKISSYLKRFRYHFNIDNFQWEQKK